MSTDQELENSLLSTTTETINRLRKGYIQVSVKDSKNRAINKATVKITQKSHDFLFGVNLNKFYGFSTPEENLRYSDYFMKLFNYATISSFIWGLYEPIQNQTQQMNIRYVVNLCKQANIKLKGHTPIWEFPFVYPSWNKTPTTQDFKNRIIDLFKNFPDIEYWDLVNEPSHYLDRSLTEYYTLARGLNPKMNLIINDYGMFNVAEGIDVNAHSLLSNLTTDYNSIFDTIGLQPHVKQDEATPLNIVNNVINKFGLLGKRIHITEFMPMTSNQPVITSTWRGNWSEDVHAKYVTDYYRVCFANKYVDAISWWDFCDSPPPVWRENGGLLKYDATPKLAYTALYDLIKKEWWSGTITGKTNSIGTYSANVFYGTYTISVTYNGKTITQEYKFPKQPNTNTVIVNIKF